MNLKNYSANFVENCKIYSKELLVNEIKGKINSDKFGRSYDDVYFVVAFKDSVFVKKVSLYLHCSTFLRIYISPQIWYTFLYEKCYNSVENWTIATE